MSKLEQLKDTGKPEKSKPKSGQKESSSLVTYQLQTFPAQNKFVETARLASLEQRLNKLETCIGTTPENLVCMKYNRASLGRNSIELAQKFNKRFSQKRTLLKLLSNSTGLDFRSYKSPSKFKICINFDRP